MSEKESLLLIAVIFSIAVMLLAFHKLNKLELTSGKRSFLIYITLLVPILGLFLVNKTKSISR